MKKSGNNGTESKAIVKKCVCNLMARDPSTLSKEEHLRIIEEMVSLGLLYRLPENPELLDLTETGRREARKARILSVFDMQKMILTYGAISECTELEENELHEGLLSLVGEEILQVGQLKGFPKTRIFSLVDDGDLKELPLFRSASEERDMNIFWGATERFLKKLRSQLEGSEEGV